MREKKWAAGLLMIALVIGGCAAPLKKSGAEHHVSLDIVPTRVASVSEVKVVQMGADLIVSGKVRKFHEFFLAGHVDIVFCDSQGTVIAKETPRLTGHASKGGGVKEGRFSAELKLVPPPGAKVCVKYHAPASGEEHL
jgi:hypothetical protein